MANAYDAPSIILYGSVSSKENSPLCSPLINPAARAKLSKRPFFSHSLNAEGIETVLFISILGSQKLSLSFTAENETSLIRSEERRVGKEC